MLISGENKGKPEEGVRRVKPFFFFLFSFLFHSQKVYSSQHRVQVLVVPASQRFQQRSLAFFLVPFLKSPFFCCFVLFSFVGSPPTELCLESFLAEPLIIPAATKVTLSEVPVKRLPT